MLRSLGRRELGTTERQLRNIEAFHSECHFLACMADLELAFYWLHRKEQRWQSLLSQPGLKITVLKKLFVLER